MERFPRLYRLENEKYSCVSEKYEVSDGGYWKWCWSRPLRGRVLGDFENLSVHLQNVNLMAERRDSWSWELDGNSTFSVAALRKILEDRRLGSDDRQNAAATCWNNLIPKKVCIFVWRALQDKLPVRVALDRRGIDLDTTLCPMCGDDVESLAHCLIHCSIASQVWKDIFQWWGWNRFIPGSISDLLLHPGHQSFSSCTLKAWHGVIWTAAYIIWRARNRLVFNRKRPISGVFLPLIQVNSYNWIKRRGKRGTLQWKSWCDNPVAASCRLEAVPVEEGRADC